MKRRIALLSPRLDSGDAVGSDALGMAAALRALGADVRLFAEGWNLSEDIVHVRHLRAFMRSDSDILIYHYSIAWNTALDLFRTLRCRKILRYHNITPPEFFEPYHSGIANNCRAGLAMLPEFLAVEPDLILTPSAFNKADLIRAGAPEERTRVLPIFHRSEELAVLPANKYVIQRNLNDQFIVLAVGRIVPNKGYEDLFSEAALLSPEEKRSIRIVCVGKKVPGLSRYTENLTALLRSSGLAKQTTFTGPVSESVLKSWYLLAGAFVSTSRHEGFCVPLVEAMTLRVPIAARSYAAVPETLGRGGICVGTGTGELTAALRELRKPGAGTQWTDRGSHEVRERFHPSRIGATFLELMEPFLTEGGS